ncbi:MAG: competence protein ComEC family protein [Bacteroidetes bacterium]|nr:competence protein ComEC family protein [Bacteroidota bacterium]
MSLNENLHTTPLIRLLAPFIAGILIQINFTIIPKWSWMALVALLTVTITFSSVKRLSGNFSIRWLTGVLITIFLIIAGAEIVRINQNRNIAGGNVNDDGLIAAVMVEPPKVKEKTVKTVLDVEAVRNGEQWNVASGRAVVFFEKDSQSVCLRYGDRVLFEPVVNEVRNAGNPNEFDYKRYLAFHLINGQAYLKSGRWKLLGKEGGNFLVDFAHRLRKQLLDVYRDTGLEDEEFAVAAALTLGYKDKLDENLKRSYSSSGAMHVLAVSGLHVGVIYLVFGWALSFFTMWKWGRVPRALIIIIALWIYAIITGLSPSVLRASAMFTFVIAGEAISRRTNIYNTLAASAFLLLIINPFMIMEVGFQLSYIAVTGIVFFQPKIYKLIVIKNKLLDKLWALTSVSVAAQIATFPLGLYYFHQFPNYFLITNIIVIPFATVLIYVALILFAFSWAGPVAAGIGKCLYWLTWALNCSVRYIENLPGSVSSGISLTALQSILIYAFILIFSVYLINKRARMFLFSLLTATLFLVILVIREYRSTIQRSIVVYNIKGIAAYNFIDGNDNILFSDVAPGSNTYALNAMQGNWLQLGMDKEKFISLKKLNSRFLLTNLLTLDNSNLFYKENFISFYDKRIFIANSNGLPSGKPGTKIDIDYVILSQNADVTVEGLLDRFSVDCIVIDPTNSSWRADHWEKACLDNNLACHTISRQGAFQVEF